MSLKLNEDNSSFSLMYISNRCTTNNEHDAMQSYIIVFCCGEKSLPLHTNTHTRKIFSHPHFHILNHGELVVVSVVQFLDRKKRIKPKKDFLLLAFCLKTENKRKQIERRILILLGALAFCGIQTTRDSMKKLTQTTHSQARFSKSNRTRVERRRNNFSFS